MKVSIKGVCTFLYVQRACVRIHVDTSGVAPQESSALFFETGFSLALGKPQRAFCFCLPGTGIAAIQHHTRFLT